MSSTSETYVSIGTTCVETIENTLKEKRKEANRHKNKLVDMVQRVEYICERLGNKRIHVTDKSIVQKLLKLNTELYRNIFAEEPPNVTGHDLHQAVTLLERICVLMLENNCMQAFNIRPKLQG